jgi:guanosine-3',5'-bis(diphosphate) 3'-pyrophosphohydrolase
MPIEMLIRTEFMNAMSEMGVLARWSYNTTDDKTSSAVMQQAQRWMNNLLELQENAGNAFEFVEGVKDDLFPDEIYVFTPEGNILELPMGSTPIDFAYAIHTDIGQTCIGARVDHQPYPLSWKLVSGQSVEIITSPTGRPNTSWLNFVVTSRARTKIKQYLNNLAADEAIVLGRRIVLNSVSFRSISEIPQDKMNLILRETKHSDCNELFRDIALGNEMSLLVVQKILGQSSRSDPTSYGMPTDKKFPIRGTFGLLINFAQCCQPVPGDEIVAQVTSGKGLIIHRCECTQLKHETDLTRDKLMQVEWDEDLIEQVFQTSITIEYINAVGVLPHLLRVISDAEGIIGDMSTYRKDSTSSVMELKIGVQSLEHLNGIIKSLKILPNVLTVSRHTYSSSRNSHAKNQMVPS